MQCLRCGTPLEEGFQVCKKCGYPVKPVNNDIDIKLEPIENDDNVNVQPVVNQEESKVVANKSEINTTTNITNSNFDVFGPENNDYNDVNIMNNEYTNQDTDSFNDGYFYDKDMSKYKYLIVTVVAAIIIVIALLCVKFIPNDGDKVLEDNPVENIITYNKVAFKNYIFNIPDKYVYTFNDDTITIGDSNGNYGIQIEISNGDYNKLVSKKVDLKKTLESKGYTSSDASSKEENDIEFLTMEVSKGEEKTLLAITKASSTNYFTISLFNKDNKIDYDLLKNASEILKLTEEVKSSNILVSKNVYGKEFETLAK